MSDSSTTINAASARTGPDGQAYLKSGERVALRMWHEGPPADPKPASSRPYETVGYVISGRAELHLGDTVVPLAAGDSWLVPAGASHAYRILETFSAIEATSPPAREHGADA